MNLDEVPASCKNGDCSVGGRAVKSVFSIKAVQVGINSDVSKRLCNSTGKVAVSEDGRDELEIREEEHDVPSVLK